MSEFAAAEPAFWRKFWQAGDTPWDQGGAHLRLSELIETAKAYQLLPENSKIAEPGCGRAHNGAALALQGYEVTSFDVTEEAISSAKELYGTVPRLTLTAADIKHLPREWQGSFDAIFDRAMLCALPEMLRPVYVKACFDLLKPNAVLMSLPFTALCLEPGQMGPPFALSLAQMEALLRPAFTLVHATEYVKETAARIKAEGVCLWRRRGEFIDELK